MGPADTDDREQVRRLLAREPSGRFTVVSRRPGGAPVVIANDPFLDDGTPMPTRYWLVDPALREAVSRLESTGGVRQAEADVDADQLADAHKRYARERDSLVPTDHPECRGRPAGWAAPGGG